MNPDIRQRWVQALRSGEYEQGTLSLARDGRYCCLGVLCELAVQEGVVSKHVYTEDGDDPAVDNSPFAVYGPKRSSTYLPAEVQDWAGLPNEHASFSPAAPLVGQEAYTLAEANDKGMTFAQIADLIESRF